MRRLALTALALLAACGQPAGPSAAATPAGAAGDAAVATLPAARTTGLDPAAMERALAYARTLDQLNALVVLRDGRELYAGTFHDGPALSRAVNIKSASKSVLSALVGIAIARGVLDGTDQAVLSVLASDAPADPDPRLRALTVGNLLSMQAGLERTSGENYGAWVSSRNWVRDALRRPFVAEPGGRMLYSTGNTHLLSAMLTHASGRSTHALAQDWLAQPLGIAIPRWLTDPQGIYFGGNDMRMTPRDLARFGELYRLGGMIDGQRILTEDWIAASWTPRTASPWSGEAYGYGWFVGAAGGHRMPYAWGYGGQMLFIVPELGLTVAMTSDTDVERGSDHIAALRRLMVEGIVPAAQAGGTFGANAASEG